MPVAETLQTDTKIANTFDDAELVKRFKSGSEEAFNTIVKRHQPKLLRVAAILLKNETDAMDIVQDVFVKAYFKLRTFREEASLFTWLYRIMYNSCITHLRRKKILSFMSLNDDENEIQLPSRDPEPDSEFENKELMGAVTKALEKLPLRQRMVFTLKQLNELKYSEIAGIMEITEGAAKASYFHAIRKLQDLLKHYGDDYGLR
ncbi:RNA polymerase sigma factor [Candidatus Latescibacterota bacterium]